MSRHIGLILIFAFAQARSPIPADAECHSQCKPPPTSNAPGVNGQFYVQYANDECQAAYSCNGAAAKVTLSGGQEDTIESFHLFPCHNGVVEHRACADNCPMEEVLKVKCESGVQPPKPRAEAAFEACKKQCRTPPTSNARGVNGQFYMQTSTNGGCEGAYSCNGTEAKVTLQDGMDDIVESFHLFECENGAIVHRNSRCADMCPNQKVTKISCEKNKSA